MIDRALGRRAIHLDFHTMPGVYDVGRDFDAEEFADTLYWARVDYVTVFAKCNLGFAYYPTKVGVVHPGLQKELLGPMVEACHRRGIEVIAYFNAGLDHEQSQRHRDWCRLNARGQIYEMESMGHFFRTMCLNTPWRDMLLAMIDEVVKAYDIDGIFLDCFKIAPCYGRECVDGMRQAGLDPVNEEQAREYNWQVTADLTRDVHRLVAATGRDLRVYHNGLPYRWQPDHIEIEVLPSAWGYDYLSWSARYARTLSIPYLTMTGRFHKSWGDFGGLRPLQSLLFDCYTSVANAGTVSVGDHMHPRGQLEPAVYQMIGQAYDRVAALEPWTNDARALAEIAVIEPDLARHPGGGLDRAGMVGATRMLGELKQQFDVCDGQGDLAGYRVLILPDHVAVTDALQTKLERHLAQGGAIISSAHAGLDQDKERFALPAYGLTYEGDEPHDPSFFEAHGAMARDLPDMLTTIYTPGIAMTADAGTEVLATLHKPYFNTGSWDWRHENLYTPPEGPTNRPALARRGNIFHFSFPVFRAYADHAVVAYRTLLRNCLDTILPRPLVRVTNAPSYAQVTVTESGKARMVHILTYVPELRGQAQLIEEPMLVRDLQIALRTSETVQRAYLAPQKTDLPVEMRDGYAMVTVREVSGYQLVVFETA